MLDPELEVSIRARRLACVVDPLLALASPHGAQLVQRLAQVADVWVTRSFWQALDASEFHRRDPLAFWTEAQRARLPAQVRTDVVAALRLWEHVRAHTDLGHCRLNWLSDNVTESALPEHAAPELIERYEALHEALAARADPASEAAETLGFFGAMDALALTAALGPARLLTFDSAAPATCLPATCAALGVPLDPAPESGGLAAAERDRWISLLSQAGAAPYVWSGVPLATVQLSLPVPVPILVMQEDPVTDPVRAFAGSPDFEPEAGDEVLSWRDAWQGARAWTQSL